jgi:hypothetical protein
MKTRAGVLLLTMALLLGSCSNGQVDLSYRFDENERGIKYLWTIDSTTRIDSSTDHSSSNLEMVIEVLEQVERENPNADPVLTVTLIPRSVKQGGAGVKTPGRAVVKYQLDRSGHITEPLSSDLASQAASALELGTILSQSRVALPSKAVGIGDKWDAPLKLDGDTGTIDLTGTGTLLGFELSGRRKLARIGTERSGDITAIEQLAGVLVQLRGKTTSSATSSLDIDKGTLYSSISRFSSDFDMALEETGKLAGTMKVDLTSKLELQPG